MIVRALTSTGDWTYGKGKNNYLSRNAAVRQNIQTRLSSFLGDCFFDIQAGIDWFNLLGSKNIIGLNLSISATILNTRDVTKLVQLSTSYDPRTRRLTIKYEVETTYTGLVVPTSILTDNVNFIVTEDGFIITTEDGRPIIA